MVILKNIGQYLIMLKGVLTKPQKLKIFKEQFFREIENLGFNSLGIVSFISLFMGAIIAIQTNYNLNNPLIPKYYIGLATRQSIILELSPTVISIILTGKIGSYIASSIGAMRITEQIDALDVMGVNSLNFLVFPKIIAALFFFPLLILLSMALGIAGGWIAGIALEMFSTLDYITGIQRNFKPFQVVYSITKTLVFSFFIVTIPSFYGYYVKGGSLEVGRSSTKAVVWTSIAIIITNYILTQLILN